MNETRLAQIRGSAPLRTALAAILLLAGVAAWTLPTQVRAQEAEFSSATLAAPDDTANDDDSFSASEQECLPPSTQQWILITVFTVVLFLICFLFLVRVVQRYFIGRDWSATLGRHWGISLTLLVSSFGMLALSYLITGCLHPRFLIWIAFPLALWVIHGLYILVAVRGK